MHLRRMKKTGRLDSTWTAPRSYVTVGRDPGTGESAVYSLRETVNGPRRYIGVTTTTLGRRLTSHYHPSTSRGAVAPWLERLDGTAVLVAELYVPDAQKHQWEQAFIDVCRSEGVDLLNTYDAVPQCGTTSGHQAHVRRGEPACLLCREARGRYVSTDRRVP